MADGDIDADGPGFSVGPAGVHEPATGTALLRFRVCLWSGSLCPDANRSSAFENFSGVDHEVKVNYATSDRPGERMATDGVDYTATSGTLTFDAGETVKTVAVTVLPDDIDEGIERVWLALSNPVGAVITRGRNFGRIHNSGPLPKEWIARFGRMAAVQVVGLLDARFEDAARGESQLTLGGRAVDVTALRSTLSDPLQGVASGDGLSDWTPGHARGGEGGTRSGSVPPSSFQQTPPSSFRRKPGIQ